MILVDTSVWVPFFRGRGIARGLEALLEAGQASIHPWILGELLLGNLGGRTEGVFSDLQKLPTTPLLAQDEVLQLIQIRKLAGCGIGWVDVQLLGSAIIADARLWTLDGNLEKAAARCGVSWAKGSRA